MENYEIHYEELVDLIYKIPLQYDGWGSFCKKLSTVINCSSVHVLARDLEFQVYSFSRTVNRFISGKDAAQVEVLYLHFPVQEWKGVLNTSRQGWYQCHHDISDDILKKPDLSHDILLPDQIRYTAAHEIIRDDKLYILIAIQTSAQRQPLVSDELIFLDKLLIHLRRVVKIQRNIYEYSTQSIIGFELIDKLSQPVILLNLSGTVLHHNHAAERVIGKNKIIAVQNESICLPEPYQTMLIQNINQLERQFKNERTIKNKKLNNSCIKIKHADGNILYLFVTLLVSENEMKMSGILPAVMLTLYDLGYSSAIDLHLLHLSFHLTPAETKVALLLLEGYLPKEIAQKNHVTEDTVRKQIRAIYKKTSTNRQSELVRLLLNMPEHRI
ncbi:helix-turn-helix transcriptional regulator [Acinetobacter chinensis]|uniref:Helix-turn-helix transcriptional regulator n=1 Tax=Acinetobacter chinensis TaxID=2004650 RepID=A0ABU3WEQ8_9GAMM|nr:helix-turn-helix transcriptional regulator [Acinetobacter chinensis]MDV2468671.1 helix-turn-helix transcriptional regulator [Acinetobacter chinensis]